MRTHAERILRALEREVEVSEHAWNNDPPDGGAPIGRVAAVVEKLRKDGHNIKTVKGRKSWATWVLVRDSVPPTLPAPALPVQSPQLSIGLSSPYDPTSDFA